MKKIKIIGLTLFSIIFLNSCAALAIGAGGYLYAGVMCAYDWQHSKFCKKISVEKQSEGEKRNGMETILSSEERSQYFKEVLSRKKQNVKIIDNITANLPEKVRFKPVGERSDFFAKEIGYLYDTKKSKGLSLILIKNDKRNLDKLVANEKDNEYEIYKKNREREFGEEYTETTESEKTGKNSYMVYITEVSEKDKKTYVRGYYLKKVANGIYFMDDISVSKELTEYENEKIRFNEEILKDF